MGGGRTQTAQKAGGDRVDVGERWVSGQNHEARVGHRAKLVRLAARFA